MEGPSDPCSASLTGSLGCTPSAGTAAAMPSVATTSFEASGVHDAADRAGASLPGQVLAAVCMAAASAGSAAASIDGHNVADAAVSQSMGCTPSNGPAAAIPSAGSAGDAADAAGVSLPGQVPAPHCTPADGTAAAGLYPIPSAEAAPMLQAEPATESLAAARVSSRPSVVKVSLSPSRSLSPPEQMAPAVGPCPTHTAAGAPRPGRPQLTATQAGVTESRSQRPPDHTACAVHQAASAPRPRMVRLLARTHRAGSAVGQSRSRSPRSPRSRTAGASGTMLEATHAPRPGTKAPRPGTKAPSPRTHPAGARQSRSWSPRSCPRRPGTLWLTPRTHPAGARQSWSWSPRSCPRRPPTHDSAGADRAGRPQPSHLRPLKHTARHVGSQSPPASEAAGAPKPGTLLTQRTHLAGATMRQSRSRSQRSRTAAEMGSGSGARPRPPPGPPQRQCDLPAKAAEAILMLTAEYPDGLICGEQRRQGCCRLNTEALRTVWELFLEMRSTFLEHICVCYPTYCADAGTGGSAPKPGRPHRLAKPSTCITPAAAAEIMLLMSQACCQHESHQGWTDFVQRYIGHKAVLQAAVMFGEYSPVMATTCWTVQRMHTVLALEQTLPGPPRFENRVQTPPVAPRDQMKADSKRDRQRSCGSCQAQCETCQCWLCGRFICSGCCMYKDTRCSNISECRAERQLQLDRKYNDTCESPLCGLRLAHSDMERQPMITRAGPHGAEIADPDMYMDIIQYIAKAHVYNRTNHAREASLTREASQGR
jgi:hypothetical protein